MNLQASCREFARLATAQLQQRSFRDFLKKQSATSA